MTVSAGSFEDAFVRPASKLPGRGVLSLDCSGVQTVFSLLQPVVDNMVNDNMDIAAGYLMMEYRQVTVT